MRFAWPLALAAATLGASTSGAQTAAVAPDAAAHAADAAALDAWIAHAYAYPERWPGGMLPDSPALAAMRGAVRDRSTLLRYAEDRLASLADHHAITGSALSDSWALVPSFADLWVVPDGERYRIDAVRDGSPAAGAGVRAGDLLVAVDGVPTAAAVRAFWDRIGLAVTPDRAGYAARVLAAGRRDRPRTLAVARGDAAPRVLTLPNLYGPRPDRPPLTVERADRDVTIQFNDSLGDDATIAAFDAAMAALPPDARLTIDLTDTPGGGNTTVARAVLGWFVDRPAPYQRHRRPVEERETGIARQWVEEVLPRAGRHHAPPVAVRVGRWTASMGEGLAIGFDAIGVRVTGTAMAGLLGSIEDHRLPATGLVVKLPTERLSSVRGTAREQFVPRSLR